MTWTVTVLLSSFVPFYSEEEKEEEEEEEEEEQEEGDGKECWIFEHVVSLVQHPQQLVLLDGGWKKG